MATYVIGDLHGCFDPLQTLLDQINYKPKKDQLWFVGDIVNRGPQSLDCLRFVKKTCEAGNGQMVLGNHDFHLLGSYCGMEKYKTKSDTLKPILDAKDADELINWLRKQPLMIKHSSLNKVMVHAGIPPQWTIDEALEYATEISDILRSKSWKSALTEHFFGSDARQWKLELQGWERIRYILNAFVRMRYCQADGSLEFKLKNAPSANTKASLDGYLPWFVHKNRRNKDHQIFFGHWSALGAMDGYKTHATDTGCLWGGALTAYCIETDVRHTLKCQKQAK